MTRDELNAALLVERYGIPVREYHNTPRLVERDIFTVIHASVEYDATVEEAAG